MMRTLPLLLFALMFATAPLSAQRYELVWADEFNTNGAPDPLVWVNEIGRGNGGWGNGELQFYTADTSNVKVRDGYLHITARRQNYGGANYTSARMKSQYRKDFTYGRFEIRAKIPRGRGLWPAVWMMPTDNRYGGWPRSGEIDIMEARGNDPTKVEGTIHYWRAGCTSTNIFECREYRGNSRTRPSGSYADDFSVYAIQWDAQGINWYVDDVLFHSIRKSTLNAQWYPFDERFYLILNLAVGGAFFGDEANIIEDTALPQSLVIDYIRVFQDINAAPTLSLGLPGGGTTLASGQQAVLAATAADTDGTVTRVDFYMGTTLLGSDTTAPYSLDLGAIPDGCYTFSALAVDNDGKASPQPTLNLTVGSGCVRQPFIAGGHPLPGRIHLADYDYGGQDIAYFETTPLVNLGNAKGNDRRTFGGVDVVKWTVADTTVHLVEATERDEWMEYTITTTRDDSYFIDLIGVGTSSRGSVDISLNGNFLITMSLSAQQDTSLVTRSTFSALPIPAGTHRLRLTFKINGLRLHSLTFRPTSTSIDRNETDRADAFELHQNHPNPFNPSTVIGYRLSVAGQTRLAVYDVLGREVAVLVDGMMSAGDHQVTFNAGTLPTGVYMTVLETPSGSLSKPMLLLK
jgi:beta-glucanase (GH16 family)